MDFEQHIYGMSEEGEAAIVYILRAENGAEVRLSNYGASVIAVKLPNEKGWGEDVITTPESFEAMLRDREYIGRTIDWSVGLRREGLHNTMWESRFETNRVVMSYEDEGVTIEAIFDFDDDMNFEVTYLAKCTEDREFDIAPNILFCVDEAGGFLQINSSELRPIEDICPRRREVEFAREGYSRGILAPIALMRTNHRQVDILTSKEGINIYAEGAAISLTPRALTPEITPAGELYCQKMVYKFSKY